MNPSLISKIKNFTVDHKILSFVFIILIISIIWMVLTGTLTYPYILASRQIELISDCAFGTNSFTTNFYGYSFSVPKEYCVLPNRLFPADGSIEIVPRGWYFVINEYAKGTIAEGAKATLLFEPMKADRNPNEIIQNLISGNFLDPTHVSKTTSTSKMEFTLVDSALGVDDQLYDWAFTIRPDQKYFLAIITRHTDDKTVSNYLLENLKVN